MSALPAVSPAVRVRDYARDRVDALLAFDPGYNQLLIALGVMGGVSATLGVVYLFVQVTHALWLSAPPGVHLAPAQAAALQAQHHGETLLAMLIGGIVGLLSAFAAADTERRPLAISMALMPVPMLASIAVAVQFLHDRTLGILVMAVIMGFGTYLPKFTPRIGPRAFLFGQMLFVGYIIGFLSRGGIVTSDLGWIAAVLWVAAAVNFVLKVVVFLPLRRGGLERTVRACFARARAVIATSAELYEVHDPGELGRARRRLARRLNRLNEAALIADALLESDVPVALEAHTRLFDAELCVQNIGRLADVLASAELPAEVRHAVAGSLARVRETRGREVGADLEVLREFGCERAQITAHPLEAGRVLRLAGALEEWSETRRRAPAEVTELDREASVHFSPAMSLIFGNLPGAALVSQEAAAPVGGWRARLKLDLPAQSAIRLTIAVVAAASLGSILSERRFYWAVLAVFISFVGTSTSGEQVFKAFNRVAGTVVGIFIGSLLAHAIGDSTWSVLVVVLALGFGIYFMRASYALMVIGITITVSQLYVQLGEYSNELLVLRLEETAVGAAVAAVAALVILPVRTRQATRVAARGYYDLLDRLLDALVARLDDGEAPDAALSALSRDLDGAAHQLRSAALPLTRRPVRRESVAHNLVLFGQVSHHARNLAAQLQRGAALGPEVRSSAVGTLRSQRRLVTALRDRVDSTINPKAFAQLTNDGSDAALTQELRRRGDLLGLTMQEGTPAEREFALHLARMEETLAELGDNLSRARRGEDESLLPARLAARFATPR